MSQVDDIHDAVKSEIEGAGQVYKSDQVMQNPPYGYDTRGKIRDFLDDIADKLKNKPSKTVIDVDAVDKDKAMADTVIDLEADILAAVQ